MNETVDLGREAKVMLWVMYGFEWWVEAGVLEGSTALSPDGRRAAQQLHDSGFVPTKEEFDRTIPFLLDSGLIDADIGSNFVGAWSQVTTNNVGHC